MEEGGVRSLRLTVLAEWSSLLLIRKGLLTLGLTPGPFSENGHHRFTLGLCYYFNLIWTIFMQTLKALVSVIIFCKSYEVLQHILQVGVARQ